jgi:SAM-dependent methyltransferase
MPDVPQKHHFEAAYSSAAPWDIGRPQPVFIAASNEISGRVLDIGCGTGDLALHLARQGCEVLGIDYLEEPVRRAREKSTGEQRVRFQVADARAFDTLQETFDAIVDCGLFHVFDDSDRVRYVEQLGKVLKPGGRLYLLCFSDREPPGKGPRRVSRAELQFSFSTGWKILSIEPTRFEINPESVPMGFSEGGPHAWFARVERVP